MADPNAAPEPWEKALLGIDTPVQVETPPPPPSTTPGAEPWESSLTGIDQLHEAKSAETTYKAELGKERGFFDNLVFNLSGSEEKELYESEGIDGDKGITPLRRAASGFAKDDIGFKLGQLMSVPEGYKARFHKKTGRLLVQPPGEKWHPFDPPGAEIGEIPEATAEMLAAAGWTIGEIASKRLPPPFGGIVSRGATKVAGAATGIAARIAIADKLELLDHIPEWSNSPWYKNTWLGSEIIKDTAVEMLGAGASKAISSGYKKIKSALGGKYLPKEVLEQALHLPENPAPAITEANRWLKDSQRVKASSAYLEVKANGGTREEMKAAYEKALDSTKPFEANAAQTGRMPELFSVLKEVAADPNPEIGMAAREMLEKNAHVANDFFETAGKKATGASTETMPVMKGVTDDPDISGLAVAQEVGADNAAGVKRARDALVKQEDKVSKAADDAFTEASDLPGVDADNLARGAYAQGVVQREYDKVFEPVTGEASKKFNAIEKLAGKAKFWPVNLTKKVDELVEQYDKLPGGAGLGSPIRILKEIQKDLVDPAKMNPKVQDTVNFEYGTLQDLMSLLKTNKQQAIDKKTGHAGVYDDLITALEADRTDRYMRLSDNPKAQEAYTVAEKWYTEQMNRFGDKALGSLVRKGSGVPKVEDSKVFKHIWGGDDKFGAKTLNFHDALTKPGNGRELQAFKGGIMEDFLRANFDETGKRIKARPEEWLKKHEKMINLFMEPEDVAIMKRAVNTTRAKEQFANRTKQFEDALPSSFKKIFSDPNGADWSVVWGDPAKLTQYMKMLDKYPQKKQIFRRAALDRVKRMITQHDPAVNMETIRFDKLSDMLKDEANRSRLGIIFGGQFKQDLGVLARALETTQLQMTPANTMKDDTIKWIRQAVLGPLSHKGLVLGNLGKFAQVRAHRNFLNLVSDPVALRKAATAQTSTERQKILQGLFGATTAGTINSTYEHNDNAEGRTKTVQGLRKAINSGAIKNPEFKKNLQRALQ